MLVRLEVENILSFKEKTEFNMLAFEEEKTHPSHVIYTKRGIKLLKAASIYGENGVGKSNFIQIMNMISLLIKKGTNNHTDELPVKPFLLTQSPALNSFFSIQICVGEDHPIFKYEVQLDKTTIYTEALYKSLGEDKWALIYKRRTLEEEIQLEKGPGLLALSEDESKFLDLISMGTRKNLLLLTRLSNENLTSYPSLSDLLLVYEWFSSSMRLLPPYAIKNADEKRETDAWIYLAWRSKEYLEFLNELCFRTLGWNKLKIFEQQISNEAIIWKQDNFGISDKNEVVFRGDDDKFYLLESTVDYIANGKTFPMPFKTESDGTKRLIQLSQELFFAIHTSKVLIIDELDQHLHPHLLEYFIKYFFAKSKNSQFIFTTHQTHILSEEMFRNDEIWFIERDFETKSSCLYPLSDINLEGDTRYLEKQYLEGRFGGIPTIGNKDVF